MTDGNLPHFIAPFDELVYCTNSSFSPRLEVGVTFSLLDTNVDCPVTKSHHLGHQLQQI